MHELDRSRRDADQPGEFDLVDRHLEALLAVHRDHGDPDPVLELERLVGLDVHLVELERGTGADGPDGLAGDVAQVAAGPREQDDAMHRPIVAADGGLRDCTLVRHADLDDLELHRRLTDGDVGAFDTLYRRYAGVAMGLAFRLTGHHALAQEVVHDAFLALWRAPEAFDPARGAFRTFLLSLVHHRGVDAIRREERLRDRQERAANLEPAEVEDPSESVADEDLVARRRHEVRAALEDLSPEQRQVLEMAYFGGMTQARIAEELGIPLGTVKTRTFAALRKLRSRLEAEG